jgi:hypothetical protein
MNLHLPLQFSGLYRTSLETLVGDSKRNILNNCYCTITTSKTWSRWGIRITEAFDDNHTAFCRVQ